MPLTTLLQYKTAVRAAGYDGSDDTALLDAINEARRSIVDERRWKWMEAVGNTALVLAYDTPSVALNVVDLLYVDAVRIQFGTERPLLTWLPLQELREKEHDDRTPGVPRYWTQAAGQLRVYPSPDKAYTISLDYMKTITDLAVDADVDGYLPVSFKGLVKWKAAALMAFRQRDGLGMQSAEAAYQAELTRKAGQDSIDQRQHSQQVKSYWRSSWR